MSQVELIARRASKSIENKTRYPTLPVGHQASEILMADNYGID